MVPIFALPFGKVNMVELEDFQRMGVHDPEVYQCLK
jgi:hypothetical protein